MAYVIKARSAVPGSYVLKAGMLAQLIALGDIQSGVGRGDGDVGTFVVPTEANVWFGSGGFGADGTEFTPSKRASSITNCSAGNVKTDVVIDDVTGTYGGAGGYTYGDSDQAKVLTTAAGAGSYVVPVVGQVLAPAQGGTAYGPGSGIDGTLTQPNTQYVLSSAADYGIAGTGGAKTATLPTAGNVLTGSELFGVNGNGSTPAYSPDFPDVGNVTTADTVNGSAGTLNMSLYTLISSVVAAAWVVSGHDNYTGGSAGSYPTTATSQAAQHATDAAFLETNKAEIVTTDAAILAEFGVTGLAVEGGGGIVVIDIETDVFTAE